MGQVPHGSATTIEAIRRAMHFVHHIKGLNRVPPESPFGAGSQTEHVNAAIARP